MDGFETLRRLARDLRKELLGAADEPPAAELVQRLARQKGYRLIPLHRDDVLLSGAEAVLDPGVEAVFYRRPEGDGAQIDAETALVIAHELGHLVLHGDKPRARSAESLADDGGGPADLGPSTRTDAYGPQERDELEANVFARELLLPRPLARDAFLRRGERASPLAERLQVPPNLVHQQLADALLLPEEGDPDPEPEGGEGADPEALELDPSQRLAAEHRGGPLLLEAGPGTGKTRTLVARIVHLVRRGVDPSSILALTFSNRAAEEIDERVSQSLGDDGARLWTGTFHAFALDLLRKHHDRLGLGPEVRVLDRAAALDLVEARLPALGPDGRGLWAPSFEIDAMLDAVARAKDELVDAESYGQLVRAWAEAADPGEGPAVARAREVARLYTAYAAAMAEKGVVDFGDLILLAVRLLEDHPDVRSEVRLRRRHVLVDEYQDVNRASARLLRTLVGDGERLFVVGDPRQSIYRFRGASSANVALFERDFPGATRQRLGVSYRARRGVVAAFSSFARTMGASRHALELRPEAHRGGSAEPLDLRVADDAEAEVSAVAARVEGLRRDGVPLSRQAVLCRTGRGVERMARGLLERGLPALHLGSLFERNEVRDLLAFVSLVVDPAGGGLLRVAAHPAYGVPLADAQAVLRRADAEGVRMLDLLRDPASLPDLSDGGRRGLERLAADLEGVEPKTPPWTLLARQLFDRDGWIDPLLPTEDDPLEARMRALAVHQLLTFVRRARPGGRGFPGRRLLDHVRRLVQLGEERDLRRIPPSARHLDAVRVMTVHAAKGLEFDAVHLPGLQRGAFPASYRPPRYPSPPGLVTRPEDGDSGKGAGGVDLERRLHDEEEECLFFVALSRARDHLCLYRSATAGRGRRRPSAFLERLDPEPQRLVPSLLEPAGSDDGTADGGRILEGPFPGEVEAGDLELYGTCPRRYLYGRALGAPGLGRSDPHARARRAVYAVLRALARAEDPDLDAESLRAALEGTWRRRGPVGRSDLRLLAEALLDRLAEAHAWLEPAPAETLALDLGGVRILLRADLVTYAPDGGRMLRLLRAGRGAGYRADGLVHGLLQEAARRRFGDGGFQIDVVHLGDGSETPVALTEAQVEGRLERARALVGGLASGRFPPRPGPRRCPVCPFFFVCPALPEGSVPRASSAEEDFLPDPDAADDRLN
ncbi:MAG: ATP-dependent helicase [Acidobacteriota bacterium]